MKILETFISEPERLNTGFKRLLKKGLPELFNKEYLEKPGFNKPNSILYVGLFKQFGPGS